MLLVFLLPMLSIGQTETVISKSFDTDESTTALIKLNGEYVEILASPDDKLYVDYIIDFDNYPERKKEKITEQVKLQVKKTDNHISIVNNDKQRGYYILNSIMNSLYKKDSLRDVKSNRKTETAVKNEIKDFYRRRGLYEEYLENKYKTDSIKKEDLIDKHNRKRKKGFKKTLIIKVPTKMALTVNAKYSTLVIKNTLRNRLSVRMDGGKLIAQGFANKNNYIKVNNTIVGIEAINGGKLFLNSVKKGLIGNIANTTLTSEFSDVEIGVVDQNNVFKDFSNETIIYGFSDDFESFRLNSEYSKIHYFKPNGDYKLKAFGYNTIVEENGKKRNTVIGNKDEKKALYKVKSKMGDPYAGSIHFDVVHGFVFVY